MLRKKYIPLLIYNSDDVVMSRENRKFSLTHLCKRRGVTISQLIDMKLASQSAN